jgi:uncharacterized membrane protein
MDVGPIQVIVFGFDTTDKMRGQILQELTRLRTRGLIRVIDILLAKKEPSGEIRAMEMEGLTAAEKRDFGRVVQGLLTAGGSTSSAVQPASGVEMLDASLQSVGLSAADIVRAANALPPGKAIGILMFEHTWAIPLRDAIRSVGGIPLTQGFVTHEALALIGREVQAAAEARQALELTEAIQAVAVLEAMAAIQEADRIKSAIAADVLRTLVAAKMIEDAAVQEAIDVLLAARLIEDQALLEASQKVSQARV